MSQRIPMELIEADFYPPDGDYVYIRAKLPSYAVVSKWALVEFDPEARAEFLASSAREAGSL